MKRECGEYEVVIAVAASLVMLALTAIWVGLVVGGPR